MKTKWSLLVMLAIILTACGPAVPIDTTASEPVKPWPGMKPGWSVYWAPPYLWDPFYDPSGYVWVHNERGAYRWEIASGKMDLLTPEDGLPARITALTAFEGVVWAATENGEVAAYDGKQWETKKLADEPFYNFSLAPGRLWVYGNTKAFIYEKGTWNEFQLARPSTDRGITQLVQGKDNDIWGSFDGEIWKFDGNTWQHQENAGYPRKFFVLPDGMVYFWMDNMILKYDGETYQPVMFPNNSYIYTVNQLIQTDKGELWATLWLNSEEHSFIIHSDSTIEAISNPYPLDPKDSDSSDFRVSAWTPDGVLASNQDEIRLYKDGQIQSFTTEGDEFEKLVQNYNIIGFAPDGDLWLRGLNDYRDLARYDGQKLDHPFAELPDDFPYGLIKINAQGELWASSGYSGEYIKLIPGEEPVKYKIRFTSIDFNFAPDGSLWLISEDGYLAHIRPQELEKGKVITPEYIRIGEGLTERTLKPGQMKIGPKGEVWVSTDNGEFYRYDGISWQTDDGKVKIRNSSAFAIDAKGKLWAGVDYHLYKFDGKSWLDFPQNCIFPSNLTIASDGAIWFINGCDGVYRFNEKDWTHYTREKEMAGTIPNDIIEAPDSALWFISHEAWIRYQP